jgi:hypothetical protein
MISICSAHGGDKKCYKILAGKFEARRPLGRPRKRLKDNIKMHVLEVGFGGMYCTQLAQNRDCEWAVVNMVMNRQVSESMDTFLAT